MKRILLAALLIGSTSLVSQAQYANSVLVYGQMGVGSSKTENDTRNWHLDLNPGIGYQFNNNWTLGLTGSFGTRRTRPNGVRDWTYTNTYSAGVFMRYTLPVGKFFAFFSQLEAGYIGSANGTTALNTTDNSNGFRARLMPSVAVYVFDGFALNFAYGGVDFTTMKRAGSTKANTSFDLTWGSQLNIGVSKNIFCGRMHRRHHGGGHHMKMNHGSRMEREEMEEDAKESEE